MKTSPWTCLDELAAQARRETPPAGDVSRAVLRRIREAAPNPLFRPLAFMTAGYAALATAALLVVYLYADAVDDPVAALIQSASIFVTMQ